MDQASQSSAPRNAAWDRKRIEAVTLDDDLTFEQLAAQYNFERTSDRSRVFARLLLKECRKRPAPVRVLDIGCGRGIELSVDLQWAIREHADELWGIEPDSTLSPANGLFTNYQSAVMETAELPEAYFDIAYSFMVMEHVSDPSRFMQAVGRCVTPGGVYIFATPNRRHYFTRIAATLRALRLDEAVLRMVRPDEIDAYHYPVRYKFNDEKRITAGAIQAGFARPEFVYLEERGPRSYFPGPFRLIFHALAAKRRLIRQPNALVTLVCRMTRTGASP